MKGKENKPHIGIFGRRNNGKSSLINAITGQEIAIVSADAGTTTDPVKKSIEIFGIGPVILIDTAGIDDVGELGLKRSAKSKEMLNIIDLAIVVITNFQWGEWEEQLVQRLQKDETPFLVVNNKADEVNEQKMPSSSLPFPVLSISAKTGKGIDELLRQMVNTIPPSSYISHALLEGYISDADTVVLVTPIDSEAPEGRMILPQIQVLRNVLDNDAIAVTLKEDKLAFYLDNNPAPKLIITDSQAFSKVAPIVPEQIPLTGFSILLAHQKGCFDAYLQGTPKIKTLKDNDRILMLESCTHVTSCEDIGRVKLPRLISNYTGKRLTFSFVSGLNEVPDLSQYAMVIQCGGCMITHRQLVKRLMPAVEMGIPVSNYGMMLAYINGIFDRAVEIFR